MSVFVGHRLGYVTWLPAGEDQIVLDLGLLPWDDPYSLLMILHSALSTSNCRCIPPERQKREQIVLTGANVGCISSLRGEQTDSSSLAAYRMRELTASMQSRKHNV